MITRDGNSLRTSVYRKPTSCLLDNSSYHPTSHKSATIATLVKRAHAVCSSSETLEDELQHLDNVFTINKYSKPFVNSVIEHSRETTPTTGETERKKPLQPSLTSKVHPKELRESYDLSTSVWLTNQR
jgi:hypothetical protein